MSDMELFPRDKVVGVFRGFREGGLEFHADLVLPYRNEFHSVPMHGQFLLVQLETPDEAVLGRIAAFSSGTGEEFNIRAVQEERPVPDDLRQQYLRYRVNIRVLGVLRKDTNGTLTFVASHRRLPHVGSPVAFASDEVLKEIAGHNQDGATIGHLALGEYIYAGTSADLDAAPWMQIKTPEVLVKFPVESLVSRRSFVFARAGFGKSNVTKLLFSKLYEGEPSVEKRGGKSAPVGTVIFDPDGEYFWPDDKGRPGLCDVPHLADKLVVFTQRAGPSPYYGSFVAGGMRLDIRRLRPADVVAIALGAERQEQQNVRKLRSLDQGRWERLVNLIDEHGNQASLTDICQLLDLIEDRQEAEALAARSNMTAIVRMLHDKSSQLMDMLIEAISMGKLCVIDVSQMSSGQSLILSGLILRRIFDRNQQEFTAAEPRTIPTIAVVEEAQSVLQEGGSGTSPYITWVKEGRKYDLGAMLITQQPGSIPMDILSQGDNWFVFHLLSAADLTNVRRANAHFSDDLLSTLLNEPIAGQGVFWSSVGGKPYPVPIRALSFEKMYRVADPQYSRPAAATFASELRERLKVTVRPAQHAVPVGHDGRQSAFESSTGRNGSSADTQDESEESVDILDTLEQQMVEELEGNPDLLKRIEGDGVAWGSLKAFFLEVLPASLDDRDYMAYQLVRMVLTRKYGHQGQDWVSFKSPQGSTWVRATKGRQ
ncbi:MAG: ATP-binding protein [Dehalococcoidia bacterium]